jgi:hypothetical protein
MSVTQQSVMSPGRQDMALLTEGAAVLRKSHPVGLDSCGAIGIKWPVDELLLG